MKREDFARKAMKVVTDYCLEYGEYKDKNDDRSSGVILLVMYIGTRCVRLLCDELFKGEDADIDKKKYDLAVQRVVDKDEFLELFEVDGKFSIGCALLSANIIVKVKKAIFDEGAKE